jgi:hypothetical protein
MFAVVAIGLLTIILSLFMIVNPSAWARGIISFENKTYFHAAEMMSRAAIGMALILFSDQTLHPRLISAAGYLLAGVAVALFLMGSRRHREFAVRSAGYIKIFRPAGFVSLVLGRPCKTLGTRMDAGFPG